MFYSFVTRSALMPIFSDLSPSISGFGFPSANSWSSFSGSSSFLVFAFFLLAEV
jgi:hypothetical protein